MSCPGHPRVSSRGRGAPEPSIEARDTTDPAFGDGGQQLMYSSELLRFHTETGAAGGEIRKVLVVPQTCLAEEKQCSRRSPVLVENLVIEGGTC